MLELVKLYATITYFHPTAGTEWSEATEKHFPHALRQPNRETLGAWLAGLGDPATGIVEPQSADGAATPGYTATTKEGWPTLTLPNTAWLLTPEGEERFVAFLRDAARAPCALFDLRAAAPVSRRAAEHLAALTSGIAKPTLTQRAHYGKVPEVESTTGDFRTGWVGRDAQLTASRWPRTAFLLTRHTPLPPFALALAQLGDAALFFEGDGTPQEWVPTATLPLPNGLAAQVRVGTTKLPRMIRTRDSLTEAHAWLNEIPLRSHPEGTQRANAGGGGGVLPLPKTRLHAALRLWSALWLLHPSREKLQPVWERAWPGFLAQVQAATDAPGFHRAVRRLLRLTGDGHALTLTALDGLLFGNLAATVRLQTIEGKPTIVAIRHPAAAAGGAKIGDVVTAVDGLPILQRRKQLEGYLAAGTPQARENYLNNRLLAGDEGSNAHLTLEEGQGIVVPRLRTTGKERRGETVRVLTGGAVYADLDRLTRDEIAPFFDHFGSAPALIFDLRGYVDETAWELAPYLAPRPNLVAAKFVRPVALPPEEGELAGRYLEEVFFQRLPARMGQKQYQGKVVALVDERTQSQAEHTALFLRACGALLVGSPTAGAVGDVTNIALTDGIVVRFSGQDVRFPDGTRVAGVGIQPQRLVRPTRKGIQAGRDEVLEAVQKALTSRG
ncbi:S41 family peptidase [Armatimonas sp.]|uniref:S41 family peptidase n=1 Tax=Armatimonas sp. TaxID=1872638 RepID=UPI00375221AF